MRRIMVAFAAAAVLVSGIQSQASASEPTIGSSYAAAGAAAPSYTPVGPTLVQRGGNDININEAAYGGRGRFCNAEPALDRECNGRNRCGIRVGNDICGDPAEGVVKELRIDFGCGRRDRQSVSAREGQRIELRCDRGRAEASVSGRPSPGGPGGGGRDRDIQVVDSVYGAAGRECNASRAVASRCNGRRDCSIRADNGLCGDPALGNPKTLVINYRCRGEIRQSVAREGTMARLGC